MPRYSANFLIALDDNDTIAKVLTAIMNVPYDREAFTVVANRGEGLRVEFEVMDKVVISDIAKAVTKAIGIARHSYSVYDNEFEIPGVEIEEEADDERERELVIDELDMRFDLEDEEEEEEDEEDYEEDYEYGQELSEEMMEELDHLERCRRAGTYNGPAGGPPGLRRNEPVDLEKLALWRSYCDDYRADNPDVPEILIGEMAADSVDIEYYLKKREKEMYRENTDDLRRDEPDMTEDELRAYVDDMIREAICEMSIEFEEQASYLRHLVTEGISQGLSVEVIKQMLVKEKQNNYFCEYTKKVRYQYPWAQKEEEQEEEQVTNYERQTANNFESDANSERAAAFDALQ